MLNFFLFLDLKFLLAPSIAKIMTDILNCFDHITNYSAGRWKLTCATSVEHRIAQHIAMYKYRIKDSVNTEQWMILTQKTRRYHGTKRLTMSLACCKKLHRSSHYLCILHIFYCYFRNTFTVKVFKIYLLAGNNRRQDCNLTASVIALHICLRITLCKSIVLCLF